MSGAEVAVLPVMTLALAALAFVLHSRNRGRHLIRPTQEPKDSAFNSVSSCDAPLHEPGPTRVETGAIKVTDLFGGARNEPREQPLASSEHTKEDATRSEFRLNPDGQGQ